MVEEYVLRVIEVVETACEAQGLSDSLFWDWLGNKKFKEDDGNLTPERASEIILNLDLLLREFTLSKGGERGEYGKRIWGR